MILFVQQNPDRGVFLFCGLECFKNILTILFKIFYQEKIELQTFITENRLLIYFAIQYHSCDSEIEKEVIINEMKANNINTDFFTNSNKYKNK